LPNGVSSFRVYGMVGQPEFVDRTSAYNYPARCKLALANFAVTLLKRQCRRRGTGL